MEPKRKGVIVKRRDEEACRIQFDAFLRRFFSPSQLVWEEVLQQDEPPDYYLALDNKRFAVEVTALVAKVAVGDSAPLPYRTMCETLERLVDDVAATARAESCLRGDYIVSFSRPIDNLAAARDDIRTSAVSHN